MVRSTAPTVAQGASPEGPAWLPAYTPAQQRLLTPVDTPIHRQAVDDPEARVQALVRMVPLAGAATHRELLARNGWYREFLPNWQPLSPPVAVDDGLRRGLLRRLAERPLRSALAAPVERWEMERKVRRFRVLAPSAEARFDAACCKGHFEGHGRRVLEAYRERLARLSGVAA